MPITVSPILNKLVLKEGEIFDEVVTVNVPKDTTVPKADVYFLADTTGSMVSVIDAVKAGANEILDALDALGLDICYGVGNYKDFNDSDPFAFEHQLNPTADNAAVVAAISDWNAVGGFDGSEGQLFALDQLAEAPGGPIGWNDDSKRIIVWFGDAPGHDPICTAISPQVIADITEASVTNKLVAEKISVIAISTITGFPNGLDDDPTADVANYEGICTIGGTPGQATRLADATGGVHVTGIDADNIVNTIVDLITSAISTINNLNLVPSGATAPFVTSISPAGGFGPLPGDREHVLNFDVRFTGVEPCFEEDRVFTGSLDVIADGVLVTNKRVIITVPPCPRYSVKFICGTQKDLKCQQCPVTPGVYATEINIHNFNNAKVKIDKYVLPVVLAGAPAGREPKFVERKAADSIVLPPNTATMDDCCRISELLYGALSPSPMPLMIGFLEIVGSKELNVSVVYTVTDLDSQSVSIDVQQVEGKLK